MATDLLLVRAPSGRQLSVAEWGDPRGTPVFLLHGTFGSRLGRRPEDAALRDAGIRAVTYDRPGYGLSDRMPGRTVADCAADVAVIADTLGVDRFAVSGGSGGAPHALAVAAGLPDRVQRARFVSGFAPYDAEGLDYFAGMDPMNVREMQLDVEVAEGRVDVQVLHDHLRQWADDDLAGMSEDPGSSFLDDWDLGEADRAHLARPDLHASNLETTREAHRTGVWGWVDDDLAFVRPWGFDVRDIRVPVQVRYGAQDVIVPAAHSAWIGRHVPGAKVIVDAEVGHFTPPERSVEQLAAWLRGGG